MMPVKAITTTTLVPFWTPIYAPILSVLNINFFNLEIFAKMCIRRK
jgi:hypothetical protein